MSATLPFPLSFRLPEGWRSAPPDEVGAPGVAFVALHPGSADGFTASITISGDLRTDDPSLESIAEESVGRMRLGAKVTVASRELVGSADAPGLTQILELDTTLDGRRRELVQCQVYLAVPDLAGPERRAVVEVVMTATPDQFAGLIDDFEAFLRTVRPNP